MYFVRRIKAVASIAAATKPHPEPGVKSQVDDRWETFLKL